jgi:methionyl-tRNA formyltransferase
MLPDSVIAAAKDGTINLHASLLPQYRGAAPINHALMQGEKETGLTTFFIESKIDTGAIIDQAKVAISLQDTAGSLHDKLKTKGADLLLTTVDKIRTGNFKVISQSELINKGKLKKAPKIFTENCYINFDTKTENAYNFIRGLSPYPAARIRLKNKMNDVAYTALLLEVLPELENKGNEPSEIISDSKKYLKIATKDGYINVLRIKMQGKKAMDIKSFLNGFDINSFFLE